MTGKHKLDYPWHKAPPEANFAATDGDGRSYWYHTAPREGEHTDRWLPTLSNLAFRKIRSLQIRHLPCPHWRSTLQARPVAKPKVVTATTVTPANSTKHTVGAAFLLGGLPAVAYRPWPKPKKVRKQWCGILRFSSKAMAKNWANNPNAYILACRFPAEVRYLPVWRGRKGGVK